LLIDVYLFFIFDLVLIIGPTVNLSDDVAVIEFKQNLLPVRKEISLEVFLFPGLVHHLNDVTFFVKLLFSSLKHFIRANQLCKLANSAAQNFTRFTQES